MMEHLNKINGTLTAHGEELGTIRRTCMDIAEQEQSINQCLEGLTEAFTRIADELATIVSYIKRDEREDEVDHEQV